MYSTLEGHLEFILWCSPEALYSTVHINGSFTKEDMPFGVQDFNLKKQFKETKNKITKATM